MRVFRGRCRHAIRRQNKIVGDLQVCGEIKFRDEVEPRHFFNVQKRVHPLLIVFLVELSADCALRKHERVRLWTRISLQQFRFLLAVLRCSGVVDAVDLRSFIRHKVGVR